MPRPSDDYYRNLPAKIGQVLTAEQYQEVEELGLLVDKDDQVCAQCAQRAGRAVPSSVLGGGGSWAAGG